MTGTQRLGAVAVAGVALAGTAYGVGRHAGAAGVSQVQYAQPGTSPVANAVAPAQGVVMACAAGERALVRPTLVGGSPVSQVECVSEAAAGAGMANPAMPAATRQAWAEPVTYGTPAVYTPASTPSYRSVRNSDVVEYPAGPASDPRDRAVVEEERRDHRLLGRCRRGRRRCHGRQEGRAHRRGDWRWRRGDLGSGHASTGPVTLLQVAHSASPEEEDTPPRASARRRWRPAPGARRRGWRGSRASRLPSGEPPRKATM